MPLTTEQINEILAEQIKPNQHGSYTPPKFIPKQVGPVTFLRDGITKKCVHTGHYSNGEHIEGKMCGAPAFITVYGKRMCILHALIVCNLKLHELGEAA